LPQLPKTPVAAKSEPKTPAKVHSNISHLLQLINANFHLQQRQDAPAPAPMPVVSPAAQTAAAPATPAAAIPGHTAPVVQPMKHGDLMTAAQRKGCLLEMNNPAHRYRRACCSQAVSLRHILNREPFSKLEIRAQVSFVFDNPLLPLQSRKTWEQFIKETGSKRSLDSLKSVCNSVAFLRCGHSHATPTSRFLNLSTTIATSSL
jgi:hypothetical protein